MASRTSCMQLVLDFDGTITSDDTTAIIGARCIAKARALAPTGYPSDQLPKDMKYYSDVYFQQYKQWKEKSEIAPEQRRTIEDEVLHLSQSRQVELNSFLRVRKAVLDVGAEMAEFETDESLRNEFMMHAGREAVLSGEVRIRDPEALKSIIDRSSQWGIVSVSWSKRFILGVLVESGLILEANSDAVAKRIKANELLAPLPVSLEGEARVTCSATDKREEFQSLLDDWRVLNERNGSSEHDAKAIYVGDSSTDLGCLASASIGLYIGEDRTSDSLIETLDGLGVRREALNESDLSQVTEALFTNYNQRPSIYFVKNFLEVDKLLSGLG